MHSSPQFEKPSSVLASPLEQLLPRERHLRTTKYNILRGQLYNSPDHKILIYRGFNSVSVTLSAFHFLLLLSDGWWMGGYLMETNDWDGKGVYLFGCVLVCVVRDAC